MAGICLLAFCAMLTFATETKIRGKLAPTVEAGGWLIVTDTEKYLLLNSGGFTSKKWFKEGAVVEAVGVIRKDVVTIYQEGVPFEASSVTPVPDKQSSNSHSNLQQATSLPPVENSFPGSNLSAVLPVSWQIDLGSAGCRLLRCHQTDRGL